MDAEDTEQTPAAAEAGGWEGTAHHRLVPAGGVVFWTAAEVMHVTGVPGLDITFGTLGVALAAEWLGRKRPEVARQVAVSAATAGSWLAAATWIGPLGGPWHAMTWLWLTGTSLFWWWLHKHPAMVERRQWRAKRIQFLHKASPWGLRGAHLLDHDERWYGDDLISEWFVLDVTGTTRLASQFLSGSVAERIAQVEMLAPSRVRIKKGLIAGRIEVTIQRSDPWAHPNPHPSLTPHPEIELPGLGEATCREPLPVGEDPDTGNLLTFPVWTAEKGALTAYLLGTRGAGKTVLLSNIRERLTACKDALVININVSDNFSTDADWAPACHLTATGPGDVTRAVKIIRMVRKMARYRSETAHTRKDRDFKPTAADPLIVAIFDEIDEASKFAAIKKEVSRGFSKDRALGVAWILAGQRATAEWMGGADTRANIDVNALGQVRTTSEAMHLVGDLAYVIPDMADYGEGNPGVWAIVPAKGAAPALGRTWKLRDRKDIEALVDARADFQPNLTAGMVAYLGEKYQELLAEDAYAHWSDDRGEPSDIPPATPLPDTPEGYQDEGAEGDPSPTEGAVATLTRPDRDPAESLHTLNEELDAFLPSELVDRLRTMDAAAREARETLAGLPDPGSFPEVTPEQLAAHTAARWEDAVSGIEIPPQMIKEIAKRLVTGMSARALAESLGENKTKITGWLHKLRVAEQVKIIGKSRAAQWIWVGEWPNGAGPDPRNGDGS